MSGKYGTTFRLLMGLDKFSGTNRTQQARAASLQRSKYMTQTFTLACFE